MTTARVRLRRRRGQLQSFLRSLRYRLVIPVFRSRHPPEYTARGVANGVFWGLTPSVGLQTFEIVATWIIARKVFGKDSSLVQALIWVWINNPVTMVPMYYLFYLTGVLLVGDAGLAKGYDAFYALWQQPGVRWTDALGSIAQAVGVPTVLGSIPYAALGGLASYYWSLNVVRRRRARITAPL